MDKEKGMIVTDDDISEWRYISDHEYSSDDSKEEKIGRDSEVEEVSDDCVNEEESYVEKEEKICRNSYRTKIDHLRRQKQIDQGEKQKLGVLIASSQI